MEPRASMGHNSESQADSRGRWRAQTGPAARDARGNPQRPVYSLSPGCLRPAREGGRCRLGLRGTERDQCVCPALASSSWSNSHRPKTADPAWPRNGPARSHGPGVLSLLANATETGRVRGSSAPSFRQGRGSGMAPTLPPDSLIASARELASRRRLKNEWALAASQLLIQTFSPSFS